MILQALNAYYNRLAGDPEQSADLAPFGYSRQKISFRVVIEPDGCLHAFQSAESPDVRGRHMPLSLIMPGQAKPSGSGINPCFLWDNATYLLGLVPEGREADWATQRFEAFRRRHLDAQSQIEDEAFTSVCRFLETWQPERVNEYPELKEITHHFGVFQVRGQAGYIHDQPAVKSYWQKRDQAGGDSVSTGLCLVTGEEAPIARLHEPKIKGVVGAQSAGALLVSFNEEAYTSYGKTQSYNAPVSVEAAFKYTTALNRLLADRQRRVVIGDATTVFWTDRPSPIERMWGPVIDSKTAAEDTERLAQAGVFLQRVRRGLTGPDDLGQPGTRYYILGLSPNASRVSVRYWLTGTVEELEHHLCQHLEDLDMVGGRPDDPPPVVRQLLLETAREPKDIPPLLGGALMRSILTGQPYPEAFYMTVLRRVQIDRKITHRRAAILKAYLVRYFRQRNLNKEIPVSLDESRTDAPYLLGRLFAVYEKIQKDAQGDNLNRTVKDSYYSTASTSPASVFMRLDHLSQHHQGKLKRDKPGLAVTRQKLLGQIYDALTEFPTHLSLQDQGVFTIGYYQQTQQFYAKKDNNPE